MSLTTHMTANASSRVKISHWNGFLSSLFSPLEVKPRDQTEFNATVALDRLDGLSLTKTYSTATSIEHTSQHVARTPKRHLHLMMSLDGSPIEISHCGHTTRLDEGDFVLVDDSAPFRIVLPEPNCALGLTVRPAMLERLIPQARSLCGLRLSGSCGLGTMAKLMLRSLWSQIESELPHDYTLPVVTNLLNVVACAFAMEHGTTAGKRAVVGARKAEIDQFLELRLRDADLNADFVARRFNVSARYIRMIFAQSGERLSKRILDRRLEECAAQLANPLWRNQTITDIAFSWGFSNMAYFSRAFKLRYGCTPRDYRRHAGSPCDVL